MATISNNEIANAIFEIMKVKKEEEYSDFFKSVALFLKKRNLIFKSKEIFKYLEGLINEKEEKLLVKVRSAKRLNEVVKKDLAEFLKKHYQKKSVIFDEYLDEKLLGGVRLEVGDEVIDMTIKKKVQKLQEYLSR